MTPQEMIALLLSRGWTQERLAAALGTSQTMISRIATGKTRWPRYTVVDSLRELTRRHTLYDTDKTKLASLLK